MIEILHMWQAYGSRYWLESTSLKHKRCHGSPYYWRSLFLFNVEGVFCLFVCLFFFCPLESKFISMTSFDRGFGGLGAKLGILAEGYSDVMKLITKGLA